MTEGRHAAGPATTAVGEQPGVREEPVYFAVSVPKLVVLSVCSASLYQFFWFYSNWKLEQRRTGERISPFWRTFFIYFYLYGLLRRMRERSLRAGVPAAFAPGWLTALYIVLTLAAALPGAWWLITFFSVAPLVPVQRSVNLLNAQERPNADRNARYTGLNVLLIVLGGIVTALAVVGSFLPTK